MLWPSDPLFTYGPLSRLGRSTGDGPRSVAQERLISGRTDILKFLQTLTSRIRVGYLPKFDIVLEQNYSVGIVFPEVVMIQLPLSMLNLSISFGFQLRARPPGPQTHPRCLSTGMPLFVCRLAQKVLKHYSGAYDVDPRVFVQL